MNRTKESLDRRIMFGALAVVVLAFAVSVAYRYRFLIEDDLVGIHQFLLMHSTIIAENWHRSGFFNAHGLLYWYAKSIEYPGPLFQQVYTSFPAGGFILPYFVSWLFKLEVTPWLFQVYALLNQFFIGLTVFAIARQLTTPIAARPIVRAVFCVMPACSIFFAPGYLWHFGSTWFAEQAGVLPFVVAVFGDVLAIQSPQDSANHRRARLLAFAAVLFGTYCDPAFFLEVSIFRFIVKLGLQYNKKTRGFWRLGLECFVPFVLAVTVHLVQVFSLFGFERLVELVRHASDHINPTDRPITFGMLLLEYARQHFYLAYGRFRYLLPLIVLLTLASIIGRRSTKERRLTAIMLLGPPLLHILVWRRHTLAHNFNTVRLDPFVALASFCVVPLFIGEVLKKQTRLTLIAVMTSLFFIANAWQWKTIYRNVFISVVTQHKKPDVVERAKLIGKKFGYQDVLMSPDFRIHALHEMALIVYSKRTVHDVSSVSEMAALAKRYPTARPVVLSTQHTRVMGCKDVIKLSNELYYCYPKL